MQDDVPRHGPALAVVIDPDRLILQRFGDIARHLGAGQQVSILVQAHGLPQIRCRFGRRREGLRVERDFVDIAQEVPDDQRITVSQEILKEFLRTSSQTESDSKVLLAHYYFEGAEVSNDQYPETEMGELEFTSPMIPSTIDLAVFGHIHLHQTRDARGVPVVFPGAIERVDWGEKHGPKGFLSLDPSNMNWKFHELPTRDMLEIRARPDPSDKDPTATILDKIPSDLEGKMVRLIIDLPLGMRPSIREDRLADKLAPSFDHRVSWKTAGPEPIGPASTGKGLPDHYRLLESFIDQTFAKHPLKDALIREGREILREALQE